MTIPLIDRARGFGARKAISAPEGDFTYAELLAASEAAASRLLGHRQDLSGDRVCFLVPAGWNYVVVQWAIWRAGGIAVPMAVSFPPAELEYLLDDARPTAVVAHADLAARVTDLANARDIPVLDAEGLGGGRDATTLPDISGDRPSLILYTSGTTGRPKGAVLSHANIQAQIESLSEAWQWSPEDRILEHLPLHHVHGIVNVLTSALWNGATCEILPSFTPIEVWNRLARGTLTLYMAVPTVYARLIEAWDSAAAAERQRWGTGARTCRLMVSGSAALPVHILERWENLTGHRLLERYGMTEIGMALSNPLNGERRAGFVGTPLPGVEVRLVDDEGGQVPEGAPGQIQVKGPTVFSGYLSRPEESAASFTRDGWFRTGDQAVVENGSYRILGRSSVDILKTGGEKISALEVEEVLRAHHAVVECAVVGVPDPDWGERVCAAVVPRRGEAISEESLREYAKGRLAPYKVPKQVLLVSDLPRNAMGKVIKPSVREMFATTGSPTGRSG